jgi:hypothetical protein
VGAMAIRRRAIVVVHPHFLEGPGALFGTGPYLTLASTASADELGVAARQALSEWRPAADGAADPTERLRARYQALGVSSERELSHDAQIVWVTRSNGTLVVTPTESRGEWFAWNFVLLPDQDVAILDEASDKELGEAMYAGWALCRRE